MRLAGLYPELRLPQAVVRLTDSTPIQPPPLPDLPPTREQQQQARGLAEAGTAELARIKAALEPRRPPKETKPRTRDPMKAWARGRASAAPQGLLAGGRLPAAQQQAGAGNETCA